MKTLYTLLIVCLSNLVVAIQGCSPYSNYRSPVIKREHKLKARNGVILLYRNTKEGVGKIADSVALTKGCDIHSLEYQSYQNKFFYKVFLKKDTFWVCPPTVLTEDGYELVNMKLYNSVDVKKDDAVAAWSRATVWINENSDMKVQIATDALIDTFNPINMFDHGFTATKQVTENGVKIELKCKGSRDCFEMKQLGLYFILTGKTVYRSDLD